MAGRKACQRMAPGYINYKHNACLFFKRAPYLFDFFVTAFYTVSRAARLVAGAATGSSFSASKREQRTLGGFAPSFHTHAYAVK
jgi:hypothetical protein